MEHLKPSKRKIEYYDYFEMKDFIEEILGAEVAETFDNWVLEWECPNNGDYFWISINPNWYAGSKLPVSVVEAMIELQSQFEEDSLYLHISW